MNPNHNNAHARCIPARSVHRQRSSRRVIWTTRQAALLFAICLAMPLSTNAESVVATDAVVSHWNAAATRLRDRSGCAGAALGLHSSHIKHLAELHIMQNERYPRVQVAEGITVYGDTSSGRRVRLVDTDRALSMTIRDHGHSTGITTRAQLQLTTLRGSIDRPAITDDHVVLPHGPLHMELAFDELGRPVHTEMIVARRASPDLAEGHIPMAMVASLLAHHSDGAADTALYLQTFTPQSDDVQDPPTSWLVSFDASSIAGAGHARWPLPARRSQGVVLDSPRDIHGLTRAGHIGSAAVNHALRGLEPWRSSVTRPSGLGLASWATATRATDATLARYLRERLE